MMANLGSPNWGTAGHPNNKASDPEWLHLRKRPRAPRIGLLPRSEAFDEDDIRAVSAICDSNTSGTESTTPAAVGKVNGSNNCDPGFNAKMTSEAAEAAGSTQGKAGKMISTSFVTVIEGTKDLTLHEEKQRSPQRPRPAAMATSEDELLIDTAEGPVPIPAKCSAQLRRLLQSHSITRPAVCNLNGGLGSSIETTTSSIAEPRRPIYPNLPYSPYSSPASSPRVRRKPLRETTRVNSTIQSDGEYVQLNQYKLEQAIGQGSYGIVKLAYNKDDDVQYAMKILSKKKLKRKGGIFGRKLPNRKAPGGAERKQSENPLQKVYREIAIMKKLDHPNVTKLVEVLDDPEDDNLYMVFELLKEGEVLVVPTDNPMSEKEAWLAFRDVVHGLEYLHYQKIIHRDLKPSNLLRADSGEVKIADLGVSNEFDGTDALLTNTAGTPAFTPPESISHKPGDEPYSGKTADIWSLGVTLFSLVYGKVPFHDDNIVALYNKIRTQELHLPNEPDISPELKCLITQMLVKDPINRISLRDIMAHEWVTGYGLYPMASELENCRTLVEVTENEVQNSVHSVPKLDTLIMVKAMIKNHSFSNPFNPATAASTSTENKPTNKQKSSPVERCDSAPGSYDMYNDASLPKNTRSNSQLLAKCSIGKLDAPEAFQIGQETPAPIPETAIPENSIPENPIQTERKPSVTVRKLTMRPFQPKPSIDDLIKEKNSPAPISEFRFTRRSTSRLIKCSIGKLDAPEAFQIGTEAPAPTPAPAPNERKPSATIRKLTMRPFQPKPHELLQESQDDSCNPQLNQS